MAEEAMVLIGEAAKLRVEEFRQALSNESERGIFIVGGTFLEKELGILLSAHNDFEESLKNNSSSLSSSYKPPTNMYGRCNQAFKKKLIYEWEHDKLHLIRDARNAFSHEIKAMNFKSPDVSPFIQELMGSKEIAQRQVIETFTRLFGLLITRVLILSAEGLNVELKRYFMKKLFTEDPF